jgi:predicted nucleic acid-binding protein
VLDACVLIPSAIADSLLRLAELELYEPLWSAEILAEVRRNLPARLSEVAIARRINAMRVHFPRALVSGYESVTPAMTNDVKDRHVLAVAVAGRAQLLITANRKDFPESATRPYGIEVCHPDDFLCELLDREPELVVATIRAQAADTGRHGRPQVPVAGVLRTLHAGGAPRFAGLVEAQLAADDC